MSRTRRGRAGRSARSYDLRVTRPTARLHCAVRRFGGLEREEQLRFRGVVDVSWFLLHVGPVRLSAVMVRVGASHQIVPIASHSPILMKEGMGQSGDDSRRLGRSTGEPGGFVRRAIPRRGFFLPRRHMHT